MPNKSNIAAVERITEEVKAASAIWIVDYRGLTVKQTEALRRAVREIGGHVAVEKNNLVKLALRNAEQPEADDMLKGPSAFIYAGEDPVAAAKALKEFIKENKTVVVKGGIMDGKACTPEEVDAIASMPSREQLIGQIAGLISGMARGLAVAISGVPRGIAVATQAVSEQKAA